MSKNAKIAIYNYLRLIEIQENSKEFDDNITGK